ncbi:unnamed protein product [Gadus morhua 'NCC']
MIVKACEALHNFLASIERARYMPASFVDTTADTGDVQPGEWRQHVEGVDGPRCSAVPFLLNSRFLPLRPVHFRVVALAAHLRAQICRGPHRNRGNVLGSFTAADQSIELKADGGGGGPPGWWW